MASSHSFLSLIYVVLVIGLMNAVNSKVTSSSKERPPAESKCNNMYNYYNSNVYAGSSKKFETLIHQVMNECGTMRDESKSVKGNKTIGKCL